MLAKGWRDRARFYTSLARRQEARRELSNEKLRDDPENYIKGIIA